MKEWNWIMRFGKFIRKVICSFLLSLLLLKTWRRSILEWYLFSHKCRLLFLVLQSFSSQLIILGLIGYDLTWYSIDNSTSPWLWNRCTTENCSIPDFGKPQHYSVTPFSKIHILIQKLVLILMILSWKHCAHSCKYVHSSYWFASLPSLNFASPTSLQPSVYSWWCFTPYLILSVIGFRSLKIWWYPCSSDLTSWWYHCYFPVTGPWTWVTKPG